MTTQNETVRYKVSFLGSGTYSNVVRVNATCGTLTWSFALGVSRVYAERAIFQVDNPPPRAMVLKDTEDMLHELASGRLVASLRQPGFLAQYRTFVLDGQSFAHHTRTPKTLTSKIYKALQGGPDAHATYWRGFTGSDADVLVVCMGLGDRGSLSRDATLSRAIREPSSVRKWLFTLQWSLLVAERTFNFQHRDIKLANIVLSDEGAGRSTFNLTLSHRDLARLGLPLNDKHGLERRFCVERTTDTMSTLVPKFIDHGFSSYVVSSLPSDVGAPPLGGDRDIPVYDQVNSPFTGMATYPSPDMFFLPTITDDERDFDSDLFTFGITALELMAGSPIFLLTISFQPMLDKFVLFCRQEVRRIGIEEETEHVLSVLERYGRMIYGLMQLMSALHGELLPPESSPLRQTLLYRVLSHSRALTLIREDTETSQRLARSLAAIRVAQGPEAISFLGSCITWDKSARGAFPGGPRVHPEMPGALRLLWHPYFAPLLSTAEEAAKSSTNEHYNLRYRDPPTSANVEEKSKRFERIADRIISVEAGLLDMADDIYDIPRFQSDMDTFVAEVLSANTRVNTSMTADDEEREAPLPPKKKARRGSDSLFERRKRPALWADEETL